MRKILADPLLTAAKVGTVLVRIGLVVGMIGLGIAAAVTVAAPVSALQELVEGAQAASRGAILAAIVAAIMLGMMALGLIYNFVTHLAAIIDTVGEGEPFTQNNARRLNRMAWLAVGIQVLAIPSTLLSSWLEPQFADSAVRIHAEFSFTGLALALVLFILARVFRHGASMREELEGTV